MNEFLDIASNFFAHRKGLLPLVGIFFVIINLILQFFPLGWLSDSNLFLHFGVVIAIIGFMLAWAL
jgi:hypothetical protein